MSKLIIYDFKCVACDAVFEEMVRSDERTIACPKCSATADRQISPVRLDKLSMAMTEGMESSIDYFDKVHRERKAIEERKYAEHGDYGAAAGAD